ncbi:carboxymuconolactone decarboxylase family protein [Nonomuraea jiangxiensis]|uniref:4-carboxymuconolactone decarboxylase n=1 Tax=Nonomuraea jiangxiensis TaxID=633440 RepID=A0A1G9WAJ2_9ACTN|nr:carboxymuconolactone decarboxylase family protein [Nonomuraea jiangxiensis]SDM81307.1 4-carboxymuconolactone decarboxylase [Nonomuraea jiangxiensis]
MSETTGGDAFERGARMRRQVLGARHVDANGGSDAEAMTPLQRMVTEFGWGTVWAREELAPQQRSLITVAMLIALNRPHELRLHVKGALRNGLTEAAVREIAVHAVAYCGFPAAIDASRVIEDVIEQVRAETGSEPGGSEAS